MRALTLRSLPIRPRQRDLLALAIAALAALVACAAAAQVDDHADAGNRIVERVVDEDTLELDSGERVRLIGVDTPNR